MLHLEIVNSTISTSYMHTMHDEFRLKWPPGPTALVIPFVQVLITDTCQMRLVAERLPQVGQAGHRPTPKIPPSTAGVSGLDSQ